MSTVAPAASLRDRWASLDARLGHPATAADREALKQEIADLLRTINTELTALTRLRDETRALVPRWKQLGSCRPAAAPEFAGAPPTVRADHLGASTFVEKGWSLIAAGEYDSAEAALMRALALAPADPQAESLLGWAKMLNEKHDDALLTFQRVLMREPSNALARINVGYICLRKGIFGEAIEHLSRAIRLDNDPRATLYAHFYLGLVYLERDMFEDAQTFFQKAIALGPNLIQAYCELGRAYWFNGQREEAMTTWREGRAANSFNPWGTRCAELLATVEAGGEP